MKVPSQKRPSDRVQKTSPVVRLKGRARGPNRVREREIARVVRAAKRAGGVDRVQISFDDGTNINLILADASKDNGNSNPWDEVLTDAADQKRPA